MTDPRSTDLAHSNPAITDPALEAALDRLLARSLPAPELPPGFHARLRAAVARSADMDLASIRSRLEAEHHRQAQQFERQYVRLRWSTLGGLIGAAFVTGITVTLATPWVEAHYANLAPYIRPAAATVFALGALAWTWRQRLGTLLRQH